MEVEFGLNDLEALPFVEIAKISQKPNLKKNFTVILATILIKKNYLLLKMPKMEKFAVFVEIKS